jgi:hypothetical protein
MTWSDGQSAGRPCPPLAKATQRRTPPHWNTDMRLIVHCGLHKTASTYLQHLLHDHRAALEQRGVFYQEDVEFFAHHRIAWNLLRGDASLLDAMLADAAARGCHDAILSSEDLEGALFRPEAATAIAASAARAGAAVEWHVVLRDPSDYFASLFAQLQWHVYADALTMFAEVMNKGGLYMHDPAPNWGGTPYWFYCFDHATWLRVFAEAGHVPLVHDYADRLPFPGWRLLDRLGVLDVIERLPDAMGQNRRHGDDDVRNGYRTRIAEAGGATLLPHVDAAVAASMAAVPECARLIGERFGPAYREAIARFGA